MPIVWIPALMRDLTGGLSQVEVPGITVGEVIASLESRFPGVAARLVEDGRLRPNLTLIVDGELAQKRLRQPVGEHSEIHFLPAISGGAGPRNMKHPGFNHFGQFMCKTSTPTTAEGGLTCTCVRCKCRMGPPPAGAGNK